MFIWDTPLQVFNLSGHIAQPHISPTRLTDLVSKLISPKNKARAISHQYSPFHFVKKYTDKTQTAS